MKITNSFIPLLTFTAVVIMYEMMSQYLGDRLDMDAQENAKLSSSEANISGKQTKEIENENIKITWFKPPIFLKTRPDAMYSNFQGCRYSNCKLTYNTSDAGYSDAIIFTRFVPIERPKGQIWILHEHEPPYRYTDIRRVLPKNSFNWTISYDQSVSDIYLPYGEIMYVSSNANISDYQCMLRKNNRALMVMSHCKTPADRLKYVEQLRKYIKVDVLGKCGTKWDCGRRLKHDNCFEILNKYRFFLAFENSFCNNYFTEKVFDNFDYNTVLISRGGKKGEIKKLLPEGTFISTDDFRNVTELGLYLRSMTDEEYLSILRRKQQFTSFRSYEFVFQKAMCEVCKRMNNAPMFMKTIADIGKRVSSANSCVNRNDYE